MKTPTARQLPSGSWFVRVKVDGVEHSITRPTKKEAEREAIALKSGAKKAPVSTSQKTLEEAIVDYIESRRGAISPSTLRGYNQIKRNRFKGLMKKRVDKITQSDAQYAVSAEANIISAKTLENSWGLVSAAITYATGTRLSVWLPQVVPYDGLYLEPEQIPIFLDALKGNKYEIAILLGLSSLRRSEIVALKWENIDLKKGCIYVRGAAVYDENEKLVYKKENKNKTSHRTVPFLIPQLREAVEAADKTKSPYAAGCYPNTISRTVNRICRGAGLPEVGTHGLRRSYASLAYLLGVEEAFAMDAGGWSDVYTMRKIYVKLSKNAIKARGQKMTDFFEKCNKSVMDK